MLQIALVTKVAKHFAPKKEIWKKKLLAVCFHQFFVRLDLAFTAFSLLKVDH